jgi:uncharacterized membrane protein
MWRLYLFGLFIIAFLFVLVFAIVEDNYNQKKEFEKRFRRRSTERFAKKKWKNDKK